MWRQGSAACPTTASLRPGRRPPLKGAPLKRWRFRCSARPTRTYETDREPHVGTSRFPGKGVGKAVGSRDAKLRLLACSVEAELLRPGQRVTGEGDFRCQRADTCEHATCHTATYACRQTCKWFDGTARGWASSDPVKRATGLPVRRSGSPVVMLPRGQIGIPAKGRAVFVLPSQSGRSADR